MGNGLDLARLNHLPPNHLGKGIISILCLQKKE
jgi:hypothetical protein